MTLIGTPDWQRTAAYADKVLSTTTGTSPSSTVTLPPNVDAIRVMFPEYTSSHGPITIAVTGASGFAYTTSVREVIGTPFSSIEFFALVSQANDSSVTVAATSTGSVTMVVVAETVGSVTFDAALGNASIAIPGSNDAGLVVAINQSEDAQLLQIDGVSLMVGVTDPNVAGSTALGWAVPVVATHVVHLAGAGTVIAAPASGATYLFGWDGCGGGGGAGNGTLFDGPVATGTPISQIETTITQTVYADLNRYRTTNLVAFSPSNWNGGYLRYAFGP